MKRIISIVFLSLSALISTFSLTSLRAENTEVKEIYDNFFLENGITLDEFIKQRLDDINNDTEQVLALKKYDDTIRRVKISQDIEETQKQEEQKFQERIAENKKYLEEAAQKEKEKLKKRQEEHTEYMKKAQQEEAAAFLKRQEEMQTILLAQQQSNQQK